VETKAWEERVSYKRSILSKPWKLPNSLLSKNHSTTAPNNTSISHNALKETPKPSKKENRTIDFNTLPLAGHSVRNLKLLVLSHIKNLQRFTPADLLALENIHYATTCVARHDLPKEITERDVASMLLATLNLLLRDGNIIISRSNSQSSELNIPLLLSSTEDTLIVVGKWNLSTTIKAVAKRDGKVVVRDLWNTICSWGNGWEGTTKNIIGDVVEEVLLGLKGQEWVEKKSGVWTRLDV
jgi:hypothetical protein